MALVALGACGDGSFGPNTRGSLRLVVSTTGEDIDLDGYQVAIDAAQPRYVRVNEAFTVTELEIGPHTVTLNDVEANCSPEGGSVRTPTIELGATVEETFAVACVATGVWIVVTTVGEDRPSTVSLTLDNGTPLAIPPNSSASITRLSAGSHSLVVGVPANCVVAGTNPADFTLAVGQTVVVEFSISCAYATAAVLVSNTTTGHQIPVGGFQLLVDGDNVLLLPPNQSAVVAGLSAGAHDVELGVAPNCTVQTANPVTVSLSTGGITRDTVDVSFEVECIAPGSILVSVAATGVDIPREYGLLVDGHVSETLSEASPRTLTGLSVGSHTVELTGVPSGCSVLPASSVDVTVTSAGMTVVEFDVACARRWELAFTRFAARAEGGTARAIFAARGDGTDATFIAWGIEADWSPDGEALAFARCVWQLTNYYYYYYYGPTWECVPSGLATTRTDSVTIVSLTSDGADIDPAWSPDGATIAFSRRGQLQHAASDGTIIAAIYLDSVRLATQPSWSPDGSTLAFTCEVQPSDRDICTVKLDGTGFTRLTSSPDREAAPAWSPDGTRIAFTGTAPGGTSEVRLVAPDGSGLVSLSPGVSALRPTWSSDGSQIFFTGVQCNIYSGCRTTGIWRMNADGTNAVQITSDNTDEAADSRP